MLAGVKEAGGLFCVFSIEVGSVVKQQEDDLHIAIFNSDMQAGIFLGVGWVGVASALQKSLGKFEIGVVNCPPHGIGAVAYNIPVYLSTSNHYSASAEHAVLILFDHSRELAQSDLPVACVFVF